MRRAISNSWYLAILLLASGCITLDRERPVADASVELPTTTWITIEPGSFLMGSPSDESCRDADENQHQVTLTHRFELQQTEVTQRAFEALMGLNPSFFTECGEGCPVELISWHDAAAYCTALAKHVDLKPCYVCEETGSGSTKMHCEVSPAYAGSKIYDCPGYRLPTEAEWEYAARAKTSTAYFSGENAFAACANCGDDPNLAKIAWYCGNAGDKTHPVGGRQANAWTLHDMLGNVFEWCHDWYADKLTGGTDPAGPPSGKYRVGRGGSWRAQARNARAATRGTAAADFRDVNTGVRCARSL